MNEVRRVLELFDRVVALDAPARAILLDAECGGDAALRREVEEMVSADAPARDFFASPRLTFVAGAGMDRSGEHVGAYRLDALIGTGGMGSVYRATRADGAFDKPVALKLLTFDAGDLRARFEREQRLLGRLSHAHIATLLDVGSDARGTPYFVMEYIAGETITHHAHARRLDLRGRIELFLPVLDAVQSAHSQLIVHRDIKPGNVLVDRSGTVKLLDFGIAKLLDADAPSAATRTGMGPLTPEYASPEQVRGDPVGVPSDIYSLGMLLYELLVGARPYEIDAGASPTAIERVVCEAEPARPSVRLNTRTAGGSARDLDAVLLKALAKSPARRYASCTEFAAELRHWLAGEAVAARVPSTRERIARYVRRHRLGVSVAAAASLALLAGSGAALWQAHIAREQARIATFARDRAQRVSKFLSDTLAAANPADMGRKATIVDVLSRARRLADADLSADPATAASTQLVLSDTYRALADYSAARDCAERARSLLRGLDEPSLQIDADLALAAALYDLGDYTAARDPALAARAHAERDGSAMQRGDTASLLGEIETQRGTVASAFAWFDRALAEYPADAAIPRADVLNNYGFGEHQKGDDAAALAKYRAGVALLTDAHADGSPAAISLYGNLAAALRANGSLAEAIEVLTARVLPRQIETLGENSPDVVWTLSNLSNFEYERGDKDAMLAHALRAYRISDHLPDENQWKVAAIKRYGVALIRSGRPNEAVPVLERALVLAKTIFPADNFNVGSLESWLGLALSQAGARNRGEPLAQSAYARLLAKYGDKYEVTVAAKKNLDQIAALPGR